MPLTYVRRAAVALALFAAAGCSVKSTEAPPLAGPSGLGLTLNLNAIPDSIRQDGGDQSSIRVTAIGPDGKPLGNVPIRVDMFVNGVAQDYGTLSARSIVTNNDGVATVVYTAPPSPVNGLFGTCSGLPGNCVSIVATATGTNFVTANPQEVRIRLVPTGVILPPASVPVPAFTVSPTPVNFNIPSTFDASNSTPGSGASAISSYVWNFGDGGTANGKTAVHTFVASTTPATSFNVVLTVTNDRGLSASTTQTLSVSGSAQATGDWVYSPKVVNIGDSVLFNAEGVRPPAGHFISSYNWNFGDGTTGAGQLTNHSFTTANTFDVVLTVTDDSGQRTIMNHQVGVGNGGPAAALIVTKTGALGVRADAGGSTSPSGTPIASYTFFWGDGSSDPGTASVQSHNYATTTGAGTYQVSVRVTDNLGRTGTATTSVTVP